ncbi:hypothetical protein BHE74_00048640 [Ensete ventricosum]|nr:hypothetical protein BHE74_00048640 [Ensete ventricosum]
MLSICHSAFVKGDHTNFEIDPSFGVEATALYPDVKYTTVDEFLNPGASLRARTIVLAVVFFDWPFSVIPIVLLLTFASFVASDIR